MKISSLILTACMLLLLSAHNTHSASLPSILHLLLSSPQRFTTTGAWDCSSGVNCQDVYDLNISAGTVNIDVSPVSSGSVAQIALYAPGVNLGGTNLLTGTSAEYRCDEGSNCDSHTEGEQVSITITESGVYRLAITRNWGSSCEATGTYDVLVESSKAVTLVEQTVDDAASAASTYSCPNSP